MRFFSTMADFLMAGLTPDEKGNFKIGQSEMARLQAYDQQKRENENFFNQHNFNYDNWMNYE